MSIRLPQTPTDGREPSGYAGFPTYGREPSGFAGFPQRASLAVRSLARSLRASLASPSIPLVLLAFALAAPPALAAKAGSDAAPPSIEDTGITAFDSVFAKVRGIHDTLSSAEARIQGASDGIAAAAGQPPGTPVAVSLWEFKQRATNPIQVDLKEGRPVLRAMGVDAGTADQVNGALAEAAAVVTDLAQLPAQVTELVNACKQLPGQLNPNLLKEAGLNPLQLPKVAKTLGQNVKATVQTPSRVERVVGAARQLVEDVPKGLQATERPGGGTADVAAAPVEGSAEPTRGEGTRGTGELGLDGQSVLAGQLDAAWVAFNDAEVAKARQLLNDADTALVQASSPVNAAELGILYQTRALVHLSAGDAARASAATAQALLIDPGSPPVKALGPQYARLHKAIAKAGIVHTVRVAVEGQGEAWVSGRPIRGDHVDLPMGEHLLQVKGAQGLRGQFIFVDEATVIRL